MFNKVVFLSFSAETDQSIFSGDFWKKSISKYPFVAMRTMGAEIGSKMEKTEGFGVAFPELNISELVYEGADFILMNYSIEEKKVPKKNLERRIKELTQKLKDELKVEKLDKEQRTTIRESAYTMELVRTPEVLYEFHILINKRGRWLAIDATSAKSVDRCTEMLRKAVSSLPVVILSALDASEAFTDWVQLKDIPDTVYLGHDCKLGGIGDDSLASYKKQELHCSEIQTNISNDKLICEIGLQLKVDSGDSEVLLPFVVNQNLAVSGIKWKFDSEEMATEDVKSLSENKLVVTNAYLSYVYDFIKTHIVERHSGSTNEFIPTGI